MQETGHSGLIPGLGRSPGGGYGNSLKYSCLKNPMDRGAWRAPAQRVKELDTTERLSTHTHTHTHRHTQLVSGRLGVEIGSDHMA